MAPYAKDDFQNTFSGGFDGDDLSFTNEDFNSVFDDNVMGESDIDFFSDPRNQPELDRIFDSEMDAADKMLDCIFLEESHPPMSNELMETQCYALALQAQENVPTCGYCCENDHNSVHHQIKENVEDVKFDPIQYNPMNNPTKRDRDRRVSCNDLADVEGHVYKFDENAHYKRQAAPSPPRHHSTLDSTHATSLPQLLGHQAESSGSPYPAESTFQYQETLQNFVVSMERTELSRRQVAIQHNIRRGAGSQLQQAALTPVIPIHQQQPSLPTHTARQQLCERVMGSGAGGYRSNSPFPGTISPPRGVSTNTCVTPENICHTICNLTNEWDQSRSDPCLYMQSNTM